jgi:hypothetical protein
MWFKKLWIAPLDASLHSVELMKKCFATLKRQSAQSIHHLQMVLRWRHDY